MKEEFDFHKKSTSVSWDVDGLIPSETLTFFISKAGVGKSFLVEFLAVCFVYGRKFLGKKIEPCNVLLIDQDTPSEELYRRLRAFSKYMERKGYDKKRKLYVESMKGYRLSDGSLIERIKQDNVSVVIIDSLNTVAGKFDVNKTKDMAVLSKLKSVAITENKTLIIIHHISEHFDITADEIMTTEDTNRLTMGNSVINQMADTLYFLGSKTRSPLTDLFIRPVPKRVSLSVKPFVTKLIEDRTSKHFVFAGEYKKKEPLFEIDFDIIRLFTKSPERRGTYKVYDAMDGKHTMYAIRKSLRKLVKRRFLKENKEHPRLFTYERRKKTTASSQLV